MDPTPVRGRLTPERIFQAALSVIDEDGPGALTMRRVAASLGVEAMSLYYHVPNKSALVGGVLDLLMAEAGLPTGELAAPEWIRGTAAGFRRLAKAHPRAFPMLLTRPIPASEPSVAEPLERGLAAFLALGRSPEDGFAAVQVTALSMLALGLLESAFVLDLPTPETQLADLPPELLPLLTAVTQQSVDLDRYWQTLTEALVVGMTAGTGPKGG